ncbi:MAG: hypothetical protein LBL91_01845 [Lachnospiraceae bacterium]|jgi:hypothetical protein|nr:hypothetical protein [Lachnospiraceae bacterium]
MNQILKTQNNGKGNGDMDIKKIIVFFVIAIAVFAMILIGIAVYGSVSKPKEDTTDEGKVSQEVDVEDPKIEILLSGNQVKVVVKDNQELSHVAYMWNDGEEQVQEIGDSKTDLTFYVDIPEGKNTLKVIAIDSANNDAEIPQQFRGETTKPVISAVVNSEGNKVVLGAVYDSGLQKVEFTINELPYQINLETVYTEEQYEQVGMKVTFTDDGKIESMEYAQPLEEGENEIVIRAYGLDGTVNDYEGSMTYETEIEITE